MEQQEQQRAGGKDAGQQQHGSNGTGETNKKLVHSYKLTGETGSYRCEWLSGGWLAAAWGLVPAVSILTCAEQPLLAPAPYCSHCLCTAPPLHTQTWPPRSSGTSSTTTRCATLLHYARSPMCC